jgi:hypothetical protein
VGAVLSAKSVVVLVTRWVMRTRAGTGPLWAGWSFAREVSNEWGRYWSAVGWVELCKGGEQ